MIQHIVFFNFKDEALGRTKAENMAHAKEILEALMGKVPTLRSMRVGTNAVPTASAWDFALVSTFDDAEGLQAYVVHPEHKKVGEFIGQVRTDRASVDFEF